MTQNIRIASALLEAEIATCGAELQSLVYRPSGQQLLWQGDPQHWARRSPLLFPQIGRCWQDTLRHNGQNYTMPKHGFMRQHTFMCTEQTTCRVTLVADTYDYTQAFPHKLRIAVCYTIINDVLRCTYTITHANAAEEHLPAYYQVGGHPAFNLVDFDASYPRPQGYISLHDAEALSLREAEYHLSDESGCIDIQQMYVTPYDYATDTATFAIERHTFDQDALIFDVENALTATLYDADRRAYLRFGSNAPVLAFWSPKGGCAPFVCFEPWWGSPDSVGYIGDAAHRRYAQCLAPYGTNTHMWYVRLLPQHV
ncbi:MAG: hypothetical protein Q4A44_01280 [Bacteroidales bacterium]|nr:hypothetical protein [Bacteroidales bacterium]